MKKKLILVLVLALILSLSMAVAGGKKDTGDKPLRFMLSSAHYVSPYAAAYHVGAMATAKKLGIELTILDGQQSQQKQLEHANQAIADKYDGFLYFMADVDGSRPVIETLNRGGIAWVGVNAFPGDEIDKYGMKYYVGPDAASHAYELTKMIKQLFPRGCRMVQLEGAASNMQTIVFHRVFREELGPEYVTIDGQDCNWNVEIAMNKMTDFLTSYGLASKGGRIDLVLSHCPASFSGCVSALESQGFKPGDVPIVAPGSSKAIYNGLKSGWLVGASTQDPVEEARLGVETLLDVIKGTAKPGWTQLPTPVATPQTVENFNWF